MKKLLYGVLLLTTYSSYSMLLKTISQKIPLTTILRRSYHPRVNPDVIQSTLDKQDAQGNTELHKASQDNKEEDVLYLLNQGASLLVNKEGKTADQLCTNPSLKEIFKKHEHRLVTFELNLEGNAYVNARTNQGETPLYMCTYITQPEKFKENQSKYDKIKAQMAAKLILAGARPCIPTLRDENALQSARKNASLLPLTQWVLQEGEIYYSKESITSNAASNERIEQAESILQGIATLPY